MFSLLFRRTADTQMDWCYAMVMAAGLPPEGLAVFYIFCCENYRSLLYKVLLSTAISPLSATNRNSLYIPANVFELHCFLVLRFRRKPVSCLPPVCFTCLMLISLRCFLSIYQRYNYESSGGVYQ